MAKITKKDMKKLEKVINVLQKEFAKDKSEGSYYYSWQVNIAMAFQDEFSRELEKSTNSLSRLEKDKGIIAQVDIYKVSNQAAKNFLDSLINKK